MTSMGDYRSETENQWCPGCPNFSILQAFKKALVKLDKAPHEVCLVSGIGQAAKLPHYLKCNFFNGLHGRAIPAALGIQVANPRLTTIVVTGDGDAYGEGGNHFIHAVRRNPDLTVVVHNNQIYALTKGQASPTTPLGEKRSLHFRGVKTMPLNMQALAILNDCGFVARGFALEQDHLADILAQAIEHRGLSYVDVIQPCITWDSRPLNWFKERVFKLDHQYDSTDKMTALRTSLASGERMPIGVFYRSEERDVFASWFREEITPDPINSAPHLKSKEMERILNEFVVSEKDQG